MLNFVQSIEMKKIVLIICCFLCCTLNIYSQGIIAGISTTSDMYVDLNPNDSCYSRAGDCSFHSCNDTLRLDIDKDGIDDFKFTSHFFWSLGGGTSYYAGIKSLNSNTFIISRFDTVVYNTGPTSNTYVYKIPQALNYGDTINSDHFFNFTNTLNDLYSNSTNPPNNSGWHNIGEHYIGIKKIESNYTLWGWIRIEVSFEKVIIKDYACNKIYNAEIFPNPAGDYVIVANNLKKDPIKKIKIYNTNGQLVSTINNISETGNIKIDISGLPQNIYIIEVETLVSKYSKKLVVYK